MCALDNWRRRRGAMVAVLSGSSAAVMGGAHPAEARRLILSHVLLALGLILLTTAIALLIFRNRP
ncbi:MAG TPA: hypothetical protein VN042_11935 [Asticcacaulis sp.]|nr:hypothetical protein [Asticcacaulis sp.]